MDKINLKQGKIIKIKEKVFSADDIKHVAEYIFKRFNTSDGADKKFELYLEKEDGEYSIYTDTAIFKEGRFDREVFQTIMISFRGDKDNLGITFNITTKQKSSTVTFLTDGQNQVSDETNLVKFYGIDQSAILADKGALEEILGEVAPQRVNIRRGFTLIASLFAFYVAYILLANFTLFRSELWTVLVFSIMSSFIAFSIASVLADYLFPVIEFNFGPEHKKKNKNTRNVLWAICLFILTSLLVPFAFSLYEKKTDIRGVEIGNITKEDGARLRPLTSLETGKKKTDIPNDTYFFAEGKYVAYDIENQETGRSVMVTRSHQDSSRFEVHKINGEYYVVGYVTEKSLNEAEAEIITKSVATLHLFPRPFETAVNAISVPFVNISNIDHRNIDISGEGMVGILDIKTSKILTKIVTHTEATQNEIKEE